MDDLGVDGRGSTRAMWRNRQAAHRPVVGGVVGIVIRWKCDAYLLAREPLRQDVIRGVVEGRVGGRAPAIDVERQISGESFSVELMTKHWEVVHLEGNVGLRRLHDVAGVEIVQSVRWRGRTPPDENAWAGTAVPVRIGGCLPVVHVRTTSPGNVVAKVAVKPWHVGPNMGGHRGCVGCVC